MHRSRLNQPALVVFALALLLPGLALAQGGGNRNNGMLPLPVLIVSMGADQAVGSDEGELTGAFSTLIVYNNGLVLWAANDDGTGAGSDCSIQAQTISRDAVNQLMRNLRRAGGFRAGSNVENKVQGGQFITVTVLRDAGNSSNSIANTFSFYADNVSGTGLRVFNVLNSFFNQIGIDFDNDGNGNGTGT